MEYTDYQSGKDLDVVMKKLCDAKDKIGFLQLTSKYKPGYDKLRKQIAKLASENVKDAVACGYRIPPPEFDSCTNEINDYFKTHNVAKSVMNILTVEMDTNKYQEYLNSVVSDTDKIVHDKLKIALKLELEEELQTV